VPLLKPVARQDLHRLDAGGERLLVVLRGIKKTHDRLGGLGLHDRLDPDAAGPREDVLQDFVFAAAAAIL